MPADDRVTLPPPLIPEWASDMQNSLVAALSNMEDRIMRRLTEEAIATRKNSSALAETISSVVNNALDGHQRMQRIETALEAIGAEVAHMKLHGVRHLANGNGGTGGA